MRRPEFIARHGACPSGWLGRVIARIMIRETGQENLVALDFLGIQPADHVLEVGFGHGRTLARAAGLTSAGRVVGVDVSSDMLAMARNFNRALIDASIVELHLVDSSTLPFPNGRFDRAYSVHTIYFWKDALAHLRELRRVIRVGGKLVLSFRPDSAEARQAFPATVYSFRSSVEIRDLVLAAGFSQADISDRTIPGRDLAFVIATR